MLNKRKAAAIIGCLLLATLFCFQAPDAALTAAKILLGLAGWMVVVAFGFTLIYVMLQPLNHPHLRNASRTLFALYFIVSISSFLFDMGTYWNMFFLCAGGLCLPLGLILRFYLGAAKETPL